MPCRLSPDVVPSGWCSTVRRSSRMKLRGWQSGMRPGRSAAGVKCTCLSEDARGSRFVSQKRVTGRSRSKRGPRLCRSADTLNREVQGGREWLHIRFVRLGTITTVRAIEPATCFLALVQGCLAVANTAGCLHSTATSLPTEARQADESEIFRVASNAAFRTGFPAASSRHQALPSCAGSV